MAPSVNTGTVKADVAAMNLETHDSTISEFLRSTFLDVWIHLFPAAGGDIFSNNTVMRPHIAYAHNDTCATLLRRFGTIRAQGRQRTTRDDKERHTLRPFAMSYTILQYSTVLPFTFATFSNLF